MTTPDMNKLLSEWGATDDPRAAAKQWAFETKYSPNQIARYYNEATGSNLTGAEAAGNLGVAPIDRNKPVGGYDQVNPRTGQILKPATMPEPSAYQGSGGLIAQSTPMSQLSDQDFYTKSKYLSDTLGPDQAPAFFNDYLKKYGYSEKEFTDKFNAGSGGAYNTSYADTAKWLNTARPNVPNVPTIENVTATPATPITPPKSTYSPNAYAAPNPSQLVSGQMDQLMNKNNPYLQQAAKSGERSAQARGLLNSSMAAGAAQGAAIERALPIAQANADIYAKHNLAILQGQINSDLSVQEMTQSDYLSQRNLTLQGMISSGLSEQEAKQNLQNIEYQGLISQGLSDRQAQDKIKQIEYQAQVDLTLDEQQQIGANYRTEIEKELGLSELAAADRDSVSTAMTNYGLQLQKDILNIQMDKNTSGEEKTEKMFTAQTVYENNMNNVAALYQVDLSWDTPFVSNVDSAGNIIDAEGNIIVDKSVNAINNPELYYSNGVKKPPAIIGQNDFVDQEGVIRPGITKAQIAAHGEDVRKANLTRATGLR